MHNQEYEKAYTDMEKGIISPNMLTWMKKHDTCKHETQSDFSHFKSFDSLEKEPFFYCVECHTRFYKGKEWNPQEWDEWINDEH